MAGRQTFFSFHYARDVWRASNIRNENAVLGTAAAGWNDKSLWEEAKAKGDAAIKRLIDRGLEGTSVTAVLIGAQTATRRWVRYEIEQSIARGNGVLGVHIHNIKAQDGTTDTKGQVPAALSGYPIYTYARGSLDRWVEQAAVAAGKPCLAHGRRYCGTCG